MTVPSKWKPTTRELAQVRRIYEPLGQFAIGPRGNIIIKRGGKAGGR
jgi:hypothetical protein